MVSGFAVQPVALTNSRLRPQFRRCSSCFPRRPRLRRAAGSSPQARMHVPSDLFGGRSPERKAAEVLSTLCTVVAVRVVLAQLGGGGEGGDLPPTPDFIKLRDFLEVNPLLNGDEWLTKLMSENQLLGVRVLEVREAYTTEDFDWKECRQLVQQQVKESNVRLMRQYAAQKFGSALAATPGIEEEQEQGGDGGGAEQY